MTRLSPGVTRHYIAIRELQEAQKRPLLTEILQGLAAKQEVLERLLAGNVRRKGEHIGPKTLEPHVCKTTDEQREIACILRKNLSECNAGFRRIDKEQHRVKSE